MNSWQYRCPNGHCAYTVCRTHIYCSICRKNSEIEQHKFKQKLNMKSGKLEKIRGSESQNNSYDHSDIEMVEQCSND